jgi:type I restriction enzyme S subunit
MENKLPNNWVETELGKLTTKPQYGWTSKSSSSGDIKYLRTTDLTQLENPSKTHKISQNITH